jgi:hypothetical protein
MEAAIVRKMLVFGDLAGNADFHKLKAGEIETGFRCQPGPFHFLLVEADKRAVLDAE